MIKEHAEKVITDARFEERSIRYPFQTPATKEALLFRDIFEEVFAGTVVSSGQPSCSAVFTQPSVACSSEQALKWCAAGNVIDPSGRSVLKMWDNQSK